MEKYKFVTDQGKPAVGSGAIFPIIKQVDGILTPIGTGFFIATNSIFVTAWHVLNDVIDKNGDPIHAIGAMQLFGDNNYIIRPIIRCSRHKDADVAVGVLAEAKHNVTGEPLLQQRMPFTSDVQKIGTDIVTWAYSNTDMKIDGNRQEIKLTPAFFGGKLEEYHQYGRDNNNLPFPCYRGSINLLGGTSGGPVVNINTGKVFAVNCTGFAGFDGPDVSYYVPISLINELSVTNFNMNGVHYNQISIPDLIQHGIIG